MHLTWVCFLALKGPCTEPWAWLAMIARIGSCLRDSHQNNKNYPIHWKWIWGNGSPHFYTTILKRTLLKNNYSGEKLISMTNLPFCFIILVPSYTLGTIWSLGNRNPAYFMQCKSLIYCTIFFSSLYYLF